VLQNDPHAIEQLVSGYYDAAKSTDAIDAKGSSKSLLNADDVTFKSFREWALKDPSVLIFFTGLCTSVKRMMAEHTMPEKATLEA
jgi:hypothetical protein